MIVVMKQLTEAELRVLSRILRGLTAEKIIRKHKVLLGLVGNTADLDPLQLQNLAWIEQVLG